MKSASTDVALRELTGEIVGIVRETLYFAVREMETFRARCGDRVREIVEKCEIDSY